MPPLKGLNGGPFRGAEAPLFHGTASSLVFCLVYENY
jgi:hypothetical protein